MSMSLLNVKKEGYGYKATYDLTGSTPGRKGVSINTEVVFEFDSEGVKASVDIDFMPAQADFNAAKERLAMYFEVLAKSLRETGEPKTSIPLVLSFSLPNIGMEEASNSDE